MLIVHQLAGILLDMEALDAHPLGLGDSCLLVRVEHQRSLADDRMIELADLVALRQIRVEIILPVEPRSAVDDRTQRQPGPHRLPHALAIQYGQHPRHRRIDQRHIAVGLRPEIGRGARKELGLRGDLGMDLQPDHNLPFAGGALDAV